MRGRPVITFVPAAARPDLIDQATGLTEKVWPEYNLHADVLNEYWSSLYDVFPEFQFVALDGERVVAEGHTIPCRWDGSVPGLPDGIDGLIADAFSLREQGGKPNTLCALAVEIPPEHQGRELSRLMLDHMRSLAAEQLFGDLIAPLRPSWKHRYPLTAIENYARWTRDDGLPLDPWLRVHRRLGADVLSTHERSLRITGTVAAWEEWTDMRFPESGDYVFPEGLALLDIDLDADRGTYWEPNVWVRHRID